VSPSVPAPPVTLHNLLALEYHRYLGVGFIGLEYMAFPSTSNLSLALPSALR
jgi:hypothetical protein